MITLALTGSIGMGKSTVAAMFADAGIPMFDADAVVRELQGPGGRLVPLIEARFPGTTRDGAVDRDALSAAVLGDRDELAALEAIVHPAVHHERTRFIVEHGDAPALAVRHPLAVRNRRRRSVRQGHRRFRAARACSASGSSPVPA